MSIKNVVLSNKIVKGRYSFSKEEQNFIYHVISQISNEDKDFLEYEVCISTLSRLDFTKKNHSRFKQFAKSLVSKTIELTSEDKKTTLIASWFSSISHTQGTGVIKACFDPKLKPYLIQLKKEFVQAKLPTLLKFKSKYSSRLYLLLKSDFDRQKIHNKNLFIMYDVETLINDFEMPASYKTRYSSFKNDFLDKSIIEINEYTQLLINYSVKKSGRKITSIEFCISEKEKTQEQLKKEIVSTKILSDYIPKNLSSKAIGVLLDAELGLKNNDLKNIFDHYKTSDIEGICEDLWKCWDSPKIMSKQALLRGKIKQLDKRKTQNSSFFDEV
jgi:plasmid replication initiation protein